MIKFIFMILTFLLPALNVLAIENPGEIAMKCLKKTTTRDRVLFKNICYKKIFIVWCGKIQGTNKRCGEGPGGHYYTHAANLNPLGHEVVWIEGRYQFAACVGSIDAGFKGITAYADEDGAFYCESVGSSISGINR